MHNHVNCKILIKLIQLLNRYKHYIAKSVKSLKYNIHIVDLLSYIYIYIYRYIGIPNRFIHMPQYNIIYIFEYSTR